ncbi:MAG: hypothetical protein IJS09_05115 [Treponema sp.]|nr:hypothetical protein [Treponema sp.]
MIFAQTDLSEIPEEKSQLEQKEEPSEQLQQEQSEEAQSQQIISGIRFIGLKKTKESFMQETMKKYNGMPVNDVDLQEVEAKLQEQGIFSETDAEICHDEEDNLILSIMVKEKISFLPLPFIVYSSSTGVMGGIMLMDTNAFGVKDTYIVGGIFSKSMQMGVMTFSKPSLSREKPGFSLNASFAHRDNEFRNSDDNKVLIYNSLGGSAGASLNDKITEHSTLSIGFRYAYVHLDVDDLYAQYESELKSTHVFSLTGGWSLKIPVLNDWFLSSKLVRLSGDIEFLTIGDIAKSLTGQISIQQPLPITRLRFLGQVSLYYSHDATKTMWQGQNTVGVTIMPSNFRAPQMGGSTLGLEIGLLKTKVATFSVYGLYECMLTKDWDGERIVNQGYSAGAKMYLAKIAFPAMSLGFSHNVTKNKMKFTVSAGISY